MLDRRRPTAPSTIRCLRGRTAGGLRSVCLLSMFAVACSPEVMNGDSVLQRPNGDLVAVGQTVEPSETVVGDAMLVGGTVRFDGDVGGSYLGVGGRQDVRGRIEGSGRAVGGSVAFGASVGRNVTLAGGTVELLDDAVVGRNAYLAGSLVNVAGTVDGDLFAGAEEVVLEGVVDGNVRIEAARLTIGPSARIGGDLTYRLGAEPASIAGDAEIGGRIEALEPREGVSPNPIAMYVFRLLAFLLCGVVTVALVPGTASAAVAAMQRSPLPALGLGVLWVFGLPVVALLVAVTLVGIPMSLMGVAVYVASVYMAPAVPAMWLGDRLVSPRAESDRAKRVVSFLAGGPLVGIAILLPVLGLIVRLAAGVLGLGAMALVIRDRWR